MKPDVNSREYSSAISVELMRESDKYTIENYVSSTELMHRAAKGIFDSIKWYGKKIAIVCGSGNNGGDGYALAKILAQHQILPDIFRLSEKFSQDGRYYYHIAKAMGSGDKVFDENTSFCGYDIVVDCILGTGFRGAPKGVVKDAIDKINTSGAFVVSADINSGIDGDSGIAETAVKSDLTVSIGYYKKGMFLGDAPRLIGDLINVDIGIVLKTDYRADINTIVRLRINDDGPGVRSAVFMCGCPLSCVWCCNPDVCRAEKYKTLTPGELYEYIARDVIYFENSGGGVTFSGGEPLMYADFISDFAQNYCKTFSVCIETSLYTDILNIDQLYPLIDRWYVDFKVFDEQKHIEYTGVSNETIKRNLVYLCDKIDPEKITVTYPLIPGYNMSDDNMRDMMSFLSDARIRNIELHPYRKIQEQKHKDLGLEPMITNEVSKDIYTDVVHQFENNGFVISVGKSYREKEKCRYLKNIRQKVCKDKSIPLEIKECNFDGRCKGTCPQCEYELGVISDAINVKSSDNPTK